MLVTEEEARRRWCPLSGFRPPSLAVNGPVAKRSLTKGAHVIVDVSDSDLLDGCWWDGHYARRKDGRVHVLVAERAFGGIPKGAKVDHQDGNTKNCVRGNLRIASAQDNAANARARGGVSRYRGIFPAPSGRWVAQITKAGVRRCLGTFGTEMEAASAYDRAASVLHGDFARLNFPQGFCRGSACGAWRRTTQNSRGYCGLAGRPYANEH